MNYRGQVVALMISPTEITSKKLYLPTMPSNMISNLKLFTLILFLGPYEQTVNMLQVINSKTNGKMKQTYYKINRRWINSRRFNRNKSICLYWSTYTKYYRRWFKTY